MEQGGAYEQAILEKKHLATGRIFVIVKVGIVIPN